MGDMYKRIGAIASASVVRATFPIEVSYSQSPVIDFHLHIPTVQFETVHLATLYNMWQLLLDRPVAMERLNWHAVP